MDVWRKSTCWFKRYYGRKKYDADTKQYVPSHLWSGGHKILAIMKSKKRPYMSFLTAIGKKKETR